MEYSPSQKKIYIRAPEELGTYESDPNLPKLPLPSLEATLTKYLKSIRPFVNEKEYEKTAEICQQFQANEGQKLHDLLKEKQEASDNWLHEWWLKYGYLTFREPLIPYLNSAGPLAATNPDGLWAAPSNEKSLERISTFIFFLLQFRKALNSGDIKSDMDKRGKRYSMDQFRYLFGTTRIPRLIEDQLMFSQGSHVTVLRNGHAFSFDPVEENGQPKCRRAIEATLITIKDLADSWPEGPGIGAMTFDKRDHWAVNREALLNLGNAKSLNVIETSAFVLALDAFSPSNSSQCCWSLMTGDPSNRWADKSLSVICFENGTGGVNFEHTPMDGMVNVAMSHFTQLGIEDEANGLYSTTNDNCEHDNAAFHHLEWILDEQMMEKIKGAKEFAVSLSKQLIIKRKSFDHFGKDALVKAKVNPDTFVQACLQLTYMRLHKKPAPTYETATTRQFIKGRTETLRSCTPELVHFCQVMDNASCSASEKQQALLTALQTHDQLMSEARDGHGCDRHLFGLKMIAQENGLPLPELFTDKSFVASGGNGSFILSTSTIGYSGMSGGTSAMCLDGYGCFYNFEPGKIWFWLAAYSPSYETSVEKFSTCQDQALEDVFQVLTANNANSPKL